MTQVVIVRECRMLARQRCGFRFAFLGRAVAEIWMPVAGFRACELGIAPGANTQP